MNAPRSQWTDQQIDQIIGNLLRAGVTLSAILVSVGGVLYLVRHGAAIPDHHVFRGEPRAWSTWSGLFSPASLRRGQAIIMLGLVVLILTPIARVAFSLVAFALEHDWLYVLITSIVLCLLLYSLLLS
jgi:uncharacterized membrane protein